MKILHKNDKSYLKRSAICTYLLKRVMHTAYCNIGAMQNKNRVSPHGTQNKDEQISAVLPDWVFEENYR